MQNHEEYYRKSGYWSDRLLTDFLQQAVQHSPDKLAVKDPRFGSLTYQQLATQSWYLAAALRKRGVKQGDRFVVALPNWQQAPIFGLALDYLGAVGVHMPITGGEHEFAGVLAVSGAKGIVVPELLKDKNFVSLVDHAAKNCPHTSLRITVGSNQKHQGWITFNELVDDNSLQLDEPKSPASADDLNCLLFTSGSSGIPKGVMHSSNTIGALNTTVAPIYNFDSETIIFMAAPLGFSAGYAHGLRLAIYLGATLILQDVWNADQALETMVRERASFTLATPTLLDDLLNCKRFAELKTELSLQLILCGGSYVPATLLRKAQEKLPDTLTSVIWGMTEGIGTGCRPGTAQDIVASTDGEAFLGTELKIVDLNGDELSAGMEGDLLMRGPQQCLGYYSNPQLNEESFLPDRWFRTGDLAVIDSLGYVKITGRRKELIIRGGANISPLEIEQALIGEPGIGQLAIIGIPDERLGERICACLVANPDGNNPSLDNLLEITRRKGLAKNKWPESLHIIDALPVTAAGKLRRSVLLKQITDKIAQEETV
ncbi:MAG: AMP-binding protein [Gammaproteobacteria bacterium]|nr:AMP-binding protein [Gammaproteobacteria bacterium]